MAIAAVAMAALLAACTRASHAVAALGRTIHVVSADEVTRQMGELWHDHPGLAAYSVRDVTYSAATRDKVFQICQHGGAASDIVAFQSGKVTACAPLVFFLYSYGRTESVPEATNAAVALYDFAVTHIVGPADTRQVMNEILSGWGVAVSDERAPAVIASDPATKISALVAQAYHAVSAQHSVRLAIVEGADARSPTTRITSSVGPGVGVQVVKSGRVVAQLRATPTAVYVSGSKAGLIRLGVPTAAAAKVGSRWMRLDRGSAQYAALTEGNTFASVPSALFPPTEAVTMSTGQTGTVGVIRLSWTSRARATSPAVRHELTLSATGQHLPIELTTTNRALTRRITFNSWGRPVTVPVPSGAVDYKVLSP